MREAASNIEAAEETRPPPHGNSYGVSRPPPPIWEPRILPPHGHRRGRVPLEILFWARYIYRAAILIAKNMYLSLGWRQIQLCFPSCASLLAHLVPKRRPDDIPSINKAVHSLLLSTFLSLYPHHTSTTLKHTLLSSLLFFFKNINQHRKHAVHRPCHPHCRRCRLHRSRRRAHQLPQLP